MVIFTSPLHRRKKTHQFCCVEIPRINYTRPVVTGCASISTVSNTIRGFLEWQNSFTQVWHYTEASWSVTRGRMVRDWLFFLFSVAAFDNDKLTNCRGWSSRDTGYASSRVSNGSSQLYRFKIRMKIFILYPYNCDLQVFSFVSPKYTCTYEFSRGNFKLVCCQVETRIVYIYLYILCSGTFISDFFAPVL